LGFICNRLRLKLINCQRSTVLRFINNSISL
jgi:hypothetical protein